MKKTVTSIAGILALSSFALPAVAGPNWLVIHDAQQAHQHQHTIVKKEAPSRNDLILPLDHGPRALSTPWLNKEYEEEMAAKADKKTSYLASHSLFAKSAHA